MEDAVQTLRDSVKDQRKDLKRLEKERQSLQSRREQWQRALETQEAANRGLEEKLKQEKAHHDKEEGELQRLHESIASLKDEEQRRKAFHKVVQRMKQRLEELEDKCRNWTRLCQQLEGLTRDFNSHLYQYVKKHYGDYPWQGSEEEKIRWIREAEAVLKTLRAS